MEFQLEYSEALQYSDDEDGITLRVFLKSGDIVRGAFAKVDTGAAVCLFSREVGEQLDLDIEKGIPIKLGSLHGTIEAFGHDITFQTGNLIFHTTIYFASEYGLPRNFLGRQGWLRNIRLELWITKLAFTWRITAAELRLSIKRV
ncbi:MAG: hypothetical protein ABI977_18525 [Acidobacteriota bacterium]